MAGLRLASPGLGEGRDRGLGRRVSGSGEGGGGGGVGGVKMAHFGGSAGGCQNAHFKYNRVLMYRETRFLGLSGIRSLPL